MAGIVAPPLQFHKLSVPDDYAAQPTVEQSNGLNTSEIQGGLWKLPERPGCITLPKNLHRLPLPGAVRGRVFHRCRLKLT